MDQFFMTKNICSKTAVRPSNICEIRYMHVTGTKSIIAEKRRKNFLSKEYNVSS